MTNQCGRELIPLKKSSLPLYLQVRDLVLGKILNREWLPGSKIPTDRELSVALGINHITLGKALNMLRDEGFLVRNRGNGTFVAEEQPRPPQPQSGVKRHTGVFVDDVSPKMFASDLFNGLFMTMAEHNLAMNFYSAGVSGERQCADLLRVMAEKELCGAIIWSVMDEKQLRRVLQGRPEDFHLVFLDRLGANLKVDWSGQDDYRAGWLLGDFMKRNGLCRTIHLQKDFSSRISTERRRVNGFCDAFGSIAKQVLIRPEELNTETITRILFADLAENSGIATALFAPSDNTAAYIRHALDDNPELRRHYQFSYIKSALDLPFPNVQMGTREMGVGAVKILLARLDGDTREQIIFESPCVLNY